MAIESENEVIKKPKHIEHYPYFRTKNRNTNSKLNRKHPKIIKIMIKISQSRKRICAGSSSS